MSDKWDETCRRAAAKYNIYFQPAIDEFAEIARAAYRQGQEDMRERARCQADKCGETIMEKAEEKHEGEDYDGYEGLECQAELATEIATQIAALPIKDSAP